MTYLKPERKIIPRIKRTLFTTVTLFPFAPLPHQGGNRRKLSNNGLIQVVTKRLFWQSYDTT